MRHNYITGLRLLLLLPAHSRVASGAAGAGNAAAATRRQAPRQVLEPACHCASSVDIVASLRRARGEVKCCMSGEGHRGLWLLRWLRGGLAGCLRRAACLLHAMILLCKVCFE